MSISLIRQGLATNLATISGLRTAAEVPDLPNPPIAIVGLNSVTYDRAYSQGMTSYSFIWGFHQHERSQNGERLWLFGSENHQQVYYKQCFEVG